MTERAPPVITSVYSFSNGMLAVFDQYGQQMPDYQGPAAEYLPKVRGAGFAGYVPHGEWKR